MPGDQQRGDLKPLSWVRYLVWPALLTAIVLPLAVAATSPLLEWRDPVYVVAGFAGVFAMALLLIQPVLVSGQLPGLRSLRGRRMHFRIGVTLLGVVVVHVVGLWITSPPDVIDALLLRSPTPFSVWGVVALWALLGAAFLGIFRKRVALQNHRWRFAHSTLAIIVVAGSVIHALQIEGTMGTVSKTMLCVLTLAATAYVMARIASRKRR